VNNCKSCARQKQSHEFNAPLGELEETHEPFQVCTVDYTGLYPTLKSQNRYLLTFNDHFTKYAEVMPVPGQTAATCTKMFETKMVTGHGTPKALVSDIGSQICQNYLVKQASL
jgi:hypothetical protein